MNCGLLFRNKSVVENISFGYTSWYACCNAFDKEILLSKFDGCKEELLWLFLLVKHWLSWIDSREKILGLQQEVSLEASFFFFLISNVGKVVFCGNLECLISVLALLEYRLI